MLDQIKAFLKKNPCSKAKTIAAKLRLDRSEVNQLLHTHKQTFLQDESYQWSLLPTATRVEFLGKDWLVAKNFEDALKGTSLLNSDASSVVLVLKNEAKPMLDFLARLLALSNQLVDSSKSVTLDFEESKSALSYLDRIGFFDVLNPSIDVLPKRPAGTRAKEFKGNNVGVIEFRSIDPKLPDEDIPRLLQKSFVGCAGKSYTQPAFTMLSELFGNVIEHSGTVLPGFAGLQFYRGSGKIQVVISDNGHGIVGTLGAVVPEKYPEVDDLMRTAKHAGVALLTEVFKKGSLSQVDSKGRGIGIYRSGTIAKRFSARVSVRQTDFELHIQHQNDNVEFRSRTGLSQLHGTHICFEFMLDANSPTA